VGRRLARRAALMQEQNDLRRAMLGSGSGAERQKYSEKFGTWPL